MSRGQPALAAAKHHRIATFGIDDDPIMLQSLEVELSRTKTIDLVGVAPGVEQALPLIESKSPDVVLMDLVMSPLDGVTGTGMIKARFPRVKILVFSGHEDWHLVHTAFEAGADGFVVKTASRERLAEAIERVYDGQSPLSPSVADKLVHFMQARGSLFPHLSGTELRILDLAEQGFAQKEIADQLQMSPNTVRTHCNRILAKTGVASMVRVAFLRRNAL